MSSLRILVDCLYEESRILLNQLESFYHDNYAWLKPEQRRQLETRIKELAQLLRAPRQHECLPHRVVGGALDALYGATHALVSRLLPARQGS